ncbi:hypothetical protein BJV78DRAFT_917594 [Lactifluus subvellereus]|nr:hypothetical protein BJV78DRAFT_917594 [Lactifluus subvellereus]
MCGRRKRLCVICPFLSIPKLCNIWMAPHDPRATRGIAQNIFHLPSWERDRPLTVTVTVRARQLTTQQLASSRLSRSLMARKPRQHNSPGGGGDAVYSCCAGFCPRVHISTRCRTIIGTQTVALTSSHTSSDCYSVMQVCHGDNIWDNCSSWLISAQSQRLELPVSHVLVTVRSKMECHHHRFTVHHSRSSQHPYLPIPMGQYFNVYMLGRCCVA